MAGSISGKTRVQDEAICLARRDFSETSLVVVLLCRCLGKVSVLAKGAKRPKSLLAVDLLDIGQAGLIANPEGLGILTEFAARRACAALRTDLDKWNVALYLAEIVNMAAKEFAPAEGLFCLLRDCLEQLCQSDGPASLAALLVQKTQEVLAWAGYHPELDRCVSCGRVMGPLDPLYFSPSEGGLLCRDCEGAVYDKVHLANRAWYYLRGKVSDPLSAGKAFEVLNTMVREYLGRAPRMQPYCASLFQADTR